MELTFLSGLDANPQKKMKVKAKAKKTVVTPSVAPAPVAIAAPVVAAPVPAPVFKPSIWEQFATTAQQIIPVVVTGVAAAKNQKRIDKFEDNFVKAQGRAPTPDEIDRYMDASAPVVKVKGGVDNNTSKYLAIGGIGIVGLLVLMNRNKGQRRA